ncbi:MAG: molybdate ABC transporter substrate-binding protein [Pseudomonadota bacterium]
MRAFTLFALTVTLTLHANAVRAENAVVAVAANFFVTAERLAKDFGERNAPLSIGLAGGSTGKLYAQIEAGAPYDIFLSADAERPELLERDGRGDGRFTYALGRLTLIRSVPADQEPEPPMPDIVSDIGAALPAQLGPITLANPIVAPYGVAAMQAIDKSARAEELRAVLVPGNSVGQAYSTVVTGNAEAGLVAFSQALDDRARADADTARKLLYAPIDPALYEPIRQDAILLQNGLENAAARAFMDYLKSDAAQDIIVSSGYDLPGAD